MKSLNKNTIFVILVIGIALTVGLWRNKHVDRPQSAEAINLSLLSCTQLNTPRALPHFTLEATNGKPFTPASLQQQWSFMFFGYSHCPDICPKTLEILSEIAEKVGPLPNVQYVFISIDPARDPIPTLQAYLDQPRFKKGIMNKPFLGVTGDTREIQKLTQSIGIYVFEDPASKNQDVGQIDHSGTLILINPKGELYALFSSPDSPDTIARDFHKIFQHAQDKHPSHKARLS